MSVGCALLVLGALALGCATDSPHRATGPIDWNVTTGRWSVRLVTRDPDGAERLTRVRIAIVDGHGVVRTGASRWRQNLENDSRCRLRVDVAAHNGGYNDQSDKDTSHANI